MNRIIQLKLKILAKLILLRHKPKIIGITGSVGKTSTKEFVYQVLSEKFKVRKNIKNYNNEIGLPLTIIGAESPGRSVFGWLKVFFRAIGVLFSKDYPSILILEMGIDRPGDMKYLLSIVKCDIGILTKIGPSHLENFKTIERVKNEKGLLLKKLKKDGFAILNYDDDNAKSLAPEIKASLLAYGINEDAAVKAQNIKYNAVGNQFGMEFDIVYKNIVHLSLRGHLGRPIIESSLAAVCAGVAFNINPKEAVVSLNKIGPIPGRMNCIAGKNNSFIFDDTYNASPQSAIAALETIKNIEHDGRRIAILGDMLELGSEEEQGHREVGKRTAELGIDILITTGERSYFTALAAKIAGMDPNKVFYFKEREELMDFLTDFAKPNDLILIKGSQGSRMENIVKWLMAEPEKAGELLVRQGAEWLDK